VKTSGCAHGALGHLRQGAIFILIKTVAYGRLSTTIESEDSTLLAYGKEVSELLNGETPEDWAAELWSMFGGSMIAQKS